LAKLIYTAITSLDGYIEDEDGNFDWAMPDPEVHAFVNDVERSVGTYLYGRRIYETMSVWQTVGLEPAGTTPVELEYADLWRGADKIVYSRTLDTVSTPRTRLEREFDPDTVRRLKDNARRDLSVSGPGLAQHAFEAGLVDQIHQFVFPVVIGGGTAGLPQGIRVPLELLDERRFGSGVIHMHYGCR
jgi:dihydrofolate reductase